MREKPMIAHTDSQAAGDPPHHQGENQSLPGEEEDSCKGAEVQPNHDEGDAPIDGLVKGTIAEKLRKEAHRLYQNITLSCGNVRNRAGDCPGNSQLGLE